MGMNACQYELRQYKWNCSQRSKTYFARVMSQGKGILQFLKLEMNAMFNKYSTMFGKNFLSELKM